MKCLSLTRTLTLFGLIALLVNSCTDNIPVPDIPLKQEIPEQTQEEHYCIYILETPAQFPGGMQAWKKFVRENLKRSKECVKGKVFLSFTVSATGELSGIEVIRGIHPIVDQYAIELLEKSPKWIPGEQRGILIKSRMNIQIRFPLSY